MRGSEFLIYVHKDRTFIVRMGTSLSKSAFKARSAIILRHIAGKVYFKLKNLFRIESRVVKRDEFIFFNISCRKSNTFYENLFERFR